MHLVYRLLNFISTMPLHILVNRFMTWFMPKTSQTPFRQIGARILNIKADAQTVTNP